MAELVAARFKATTVFGIDLADILSSDKNDQRRLQETRASEELWDGLVTCLARHKDEFGQWVDEAARIEQRMESAERRGGKAIWQRRFLSRHSPLLMINHNHGLLVSGRTLHHRNSLDPSGARYKNAYLEEVNYRLTREGVLVVTFEADFRGSDYSVLEVITSLSRLREDSFSTLRQFLADYFGDPWRRRLLGEASGLTLTGQRVFEKDAVAEATHFHSLVFIEGFQDRSTGATVQLNQVVRSQEIAGILNEAHWYAYYSTDYCNQQADKQFGYRADEIYLIERRTTVIVAERCWLDDPMVHYHQDLQLLISHHVAAIALLMQQLAFFREYDEVRLIESHDPVPALPLVLAARSNLTLLNESLDFTSLVRHGFSRLFAKRLRQEMEFEHALDALTHRVADMGEAIALKSSVQSANSALQRASRNNFLQAIAVVIALAAVVLAVVLHQ